MIETLDTFYLLAIPVLLIALVALFYAGYLVFEIIRELLEKILRK